MHGRRYTDSIVTIEDEVTANVSIPPAVNSWRKPLKFIRTLID
jgi:hypothetical protein